MRTSSNTQPSSEGMVRPDTTPIIDDTARPVLLGIRTAVRRFLLQVSPLERRTNPSLQRKMNELRKSLDVLSALNRGRS